MFRWLTSLFRRPAQDTGIYKPTEKVLYSYWTGRKMLWQDPLVLYKKLMAIMPELSINIKVANSPMNGNIEASHAMARQIRTVFDVEPHDPDKPKESGLTEPQLIGLLTHFLSYCDNIKKNSPGFATPPPISPPSASSIKSAPEQSPPTPPTSASSSTAETSSSVTPTAPPSEPVSPSASSNPPLIILGPTLTEKVTP